MLITSSASCSKPYRKAAELGWLSKLFGGKKGPPTIEPPGVNLAFILLASPDDAPDADAICAAYAEFAKDGSSLTIGESSDGTSVFSCSSGECAFMAMMPMPIPNGEAEDTVRFSVSALSGEWSLLDYQAHMVVSMMPGESLSVVECLSHFTSLIAAVLRASNSVGVYWGNAGATHEPQFFQPLAAADSIVPRIMLWSGISVAREEDGAMQYFWDLLAYLTDRNHPLPAGDTIGRSATEKLKVRYVDSPIDPKQTVWRIDL